MSAPTRSPSRPRPPASRPTGPLSLLDRVRAARPRPRDRALLRIVRAGRIVLLGGALVIPGCGTAEPDGPGAENQPPSVRITGGVTEGGTASYRAELFWFGTDVDGIVDHFEVSIDEGGWTRTDQHSGSFAFTASSPTGGELSEDWHRFDVRAVDNENARSRPATRAFNAVTVAPTVALRGPTPSGAEGIAEVSSYIRVSWTGRDEDATTPDRRPVGYQLKLIELDSSFESWGQVRRYLLHSVPPPDSSTTARSNLLIPDSLSVPYSRPLPDDAHFRRTDW